MISGFFRGNIFLEEGSFFNGWCWWWEGQEGAGHLSLGEAGCPMWSTYYDDLILGFHENLWAGG